MHATRWTACASVMVLAWVSTSASFGATDTADTVRKNLQDLQSKDPAVRKAARTALGKIGPEASAAVPALTEALESKSWMVRMSSALALMRIGPAARNAGPALTRRMTDKNEVVQVSALLALEVLAPQRRCLWKRILADGHVFPVDNVKLMAEAFAVMAQFNRIDPDMLSRRRMSFQDKSGTPLSAKDLTSRYGEPDTKRPQPGESDVMVYRYGPLGLFVAKDGRAVNPHALAMPDPLWLMLADYFRIDLSMCPRITGLPRLAMPVTLASLQWAGPLCGPSLVLRSGQDKADKVATAKAKARIKSLGPAPGGLIHKTTRQVLGKDISPEVTLQFVCKMGVLFDGEALNRQRAQQSAKRLTSIPLRDIVLWKQSLDAVLNAKASLAILAWALTTVENVFEADKYVGARAQRYLHRAKSVPLSAVRAFQKALPAFRGLDDDALLSIILVDRFFGNDVFIAHAFNEAVARLAGRAPGAERPTGN